VVVNNGRVTLAELEVAAEPMQLPIVFGLFKIKNNLI